MAFTSEFWTDERVTRLEELANEKRYTAAQLGAFLGCTRSMVIGKCSREKIALLNWKQASQVTGQRRDEAAAAARVIRQQRTAERQAAILALDPISLDILPELVRNDQCRYPHGDGPFVYCGQPIESGGWYCSVHRARTHVIPAPRKSR